VRLGAPFQALSTNRKKPVRQDAPYEGIAMQRALITTALEIPGHTILKNFGIVRGITVRSRSVVGNFVGGIQSLFGGNISIYTELCEQARIEAFDLMCKEANGLGANAIIAMRYDATELMPGLTEVLCYGTAVRVSE
jgi:uncharacterized protein YbjQ (UPF0145 family)